MSQAETAELTRAIVADIRRVVDKADITRQAVELMRSGVPEDAAFYWAVPVAYALQAATARAGAAWIGRGMKPPHETEGQRIAREDGYAPGGPIYEMFWSSLLASQPAETLDELEGWPVMAYPGRAYPIKGQGCRMEGCVLWRDHAGSHTVKPYWAKWLRDRLDR